MTLLTVPEAVEHYKVDGKPRFSQWFLYTNTKNGTIPCVRISGKVFICLETFERYLENLENASLQKTGR